MTRAQAGVALALTLWLLAAGAAGAQLALTIEGTTPSLSGAVERLRRADLAPLARELSSAGLDLPGQVRVTLIGEDDPRGRATPAWIVGLAFPPRDVVIFPERTPSYPYDSLEAVLQHEIVHLAVAAAADGRALPRWFHEGVAVSVEVGWGFTDQLRLVVAAGGQPTITDVARLFRSDDRPDTALAYMLATALVDDLRRRHGAAVPGAIARRVAAGTPFERAFALETGTTIDEAASHAWNLYLGWTSWLLFLTDPSTLWSAIGLLALVALVAQIRRRRRRRRRWDMEEF